jgi:signal transduction histidine kinase
VDLLKEIHNVVSNQLLNSGTRSVVGKYLLALDAIKQINEQILESSDLHMLMNLVLFTLSGQFAVPDAFMISYDYDEPDEQAIFLGVGDLENSQAFDNPDTASKLTNLVFEKQIPIRVLELEDTGEESELVRTLMANNIKLLVPMCVKDVVFGIVGMGPIVTGKPFTDESIILLTAIMDAVSPIMALRSNEFFNQFHSSTQAVIILSPDLIVEKANKASLALVNRHSEAGQGENSLYGRSFSDVFPPSIFPGWAEALTDMKADSSIKHIRSLELRQHNSIQYFEVFVAKINSRRRNSYSLMLTFEDVTEKKATSQRLSQMQKDAERGQILSSIAHELNNYLGLLTGGLELANHAVDIGNLKNVQKHIEKLQETCASTVQFASELVGRKRHESKKVLSSLAIVVDRCVMFAKLQKRFEKIDIQLQLKDGLPLVLIDEDEIGQLLLNIVNNAADAIKEIRNSGTIQIRTYFSEQRVHLEVVDDGPGIPPEIKDKLFIENLTTKETGHGFGLTVSAQILKDHQAQYHIDTELGKGSVFNFSFPAHL